MSMDCSVTDTSLFISTIWLVKPSVMLICPTKEPFLTSVAGVRFQFGIVTAILFPTAALQAFKRLSLLESLVAT